MAWGSLLRLVIPALAVGVALLAAASSAGGASSGDAGLIAYFGNSPPCRYSTARDEIVCNDGIWTGRLDGKQARQLARVEGARFPAWSPDGRRLAYSAGTGRIGISELWVMNADGSGKRVRLATRKLPVKGPFFYDLGGILPSWSPDGRLIVVPATRREKKGDPGTPILVAVPAGDGKPRELFALPRAKYFSAVASPQFSPNGKLIAFLYVTSGARASLYVARADGTGRKRLSTASPNEGRVLDWSPDSRRIVFTRQVISKGSYNPELFVVNANGSGMRRLTVTEGPAAQPNANMSPSWSPDGRQIVFVSGMTADEAGAQNKNNRFAVINADGSGFHLVGPARSDCVYRAAPNDNGCYVTDPDWRPR